MAVLTVKAALEATSKNAQTLARCRKYAGMQGYGDDGDFCEFVTRCITHEDEFIDFSKCAAWQSNSARLNGLSAVAAVLETDCVRERLDAPGAPYRPYVDVKKKLVQLQQRFKTQLQQHLEEAVVVDVNDEDDSLEEVDEVDDEDGEESEVDEELQELKVLESPGAEDVFQQNDYMLIVVQQSRRIRDLELQLAELKKKVSAQLHQVIDTL
jgi:hypothetical protein